MNAERETFLADIIVTAVEGGINYWARVSTYRWFSPTLDGGTLAPAPNGGTLAPAPNGGGNALAVLATRDEPDKTLTLTPEIVAAALDRIATGEAVKHLWESTRTTVKAANPANDPFPAGVYGIDSAVADQIAQVALFGEVVYG